VLSVVVRALLTILVPFVLAGCVLLLPARLSAWRGRLALLGPLSAVVFGLGFWRAVEPGGRLLLPLPWIPSLGLNADLRLDRLGAFFVLLVGAIGLAIFQYAREYMGPKAAAGFWSLMLAFTGAMLGVVLADNLLLLYVFWELTTVTSALLVARASDEAPARTGALQAFLVTAAGGLALLAGVVLLGRAAGTYNLSLLADRAHLIVDDPAHRVPLLLLLLGAFTKSAQVPFHFWLPAAMAAPAPVSAFLHSATMVKAGVFLVARLFPIFADSPLWMPVLASVGLASFVIAGWNALWNDDVKKLLAYSTVGYLGLLMAHYGYSARAGLRGEFLNIANHALYKSALFLLVGWVEKATGTRDLRTLARERWPPREPVGTALFGLGALALAGSPLLLGFLSKELFLEAVIGEGIERTTPQALVVVVATALSVAYGLKIFTAMLFGSETPPPDRLSRRRALSPWLLGIPGLLLAPQILGGIAPRFFLQPLVDPETDIPRGPAVWHHVDVLLVMSLVSFGLGALLFLSWRRLLRARHYPAADLVVRSGTSAALAVASWTGRLLQAGGHPRFNVWILLGTLAAVSAALLWADPRLPAIPLWGVEDHAGWVPGVATAGAALLVLTMRRRLSKAVMLALVGYGVAFYYVLFRAPDLVLTQILVETVSLVLLLLIFRRMPPLVRDSRTGVTKAVHAAVAVAVGALMAALTWGAASYGAPHRAGDDQVAISWPVAQGRNVVNVILVDFRAADTLGEIIVLVIAALGVLALLWPRRPGTEEGQGARA
jgi:NADH:ubiquinone oxidoreductase subunit 5 (subunit L)/multisubunit Na+/H+ antiporter MnhA subunit/multisubunit Na+/H+ antiporter MnhB subunit